MAIRFAAIYAMGAKAEEGIFEQYLFAVAIHMLRYIAGYANEMRKLEHVESRRVALRGVLWL